MKTDRFEREVPNGYQLAYHLDAKNKTVGLIMNLVALVIMVLVVALGLLLPVSFGGGVTVRELLFSWRSYTSLGIFLAAIILYTVLHELVHGACYRFFTGEKLTFGVSWSCAFCGVPHVYVYRKVAIISAAAPLVLFSILLLPVLVLLWFAGTELYLIGLLVYGLHLGGCCGDAYFILLLLLRYRDRKTLLRDTGPEQYIYVPEEGNA